MEEIEKCRKDLEEIRKAYQEEQKKVLRLREEKTMIFDSATQRIAQADEELRKLHLIVGNLLINSVQIVRTHMQDHPNLRLVEQEIFNLQPLRIGADGQENPK